MATHGSFDPPSAGGGPSADFWRTPTANGTPPDGTADTTEAIARTGRIGTGPAFTTSQPVAQLDVAAAGRSGTHGATAATPLYVTGALAPVVGCPAPAATPVGGVEFRHSNGSQGVGIGFNGIYATGSATNQDLAIQQRGAGSLRLQWQGKGGGWASLFYQANDAHVIDGGFREEFRDAGCTYIGGRYVRMSSLSPADSYQQFNIITNGGARDVLELRAARDCAGVLRGSYLRVATNEVHRKKLTLWDAAPGDDSQFYGFGILSSTLVYQVSSPSAWHRWYAGTGPCTSQQVFSVSGSAHAVVDPAGLNTGGNGAGALRFGAENSGTGIASGRPVGSLNQGGLNFFTGNRVRTSIGANGVMRHQLHGQTAATARTWNAGGPPLVQIDEEASGGGAQRPMLWLETNNCGGPCGQGNPPTMVITNSNGNGLRGWITFVSHPVTQANIGDIRALNGGVMQFMAANAVQLVTAGVARLTVKNTGVVHIAGLPSSPAGLAAGDIWRDAGGVLHAV